MENQDICKIKDIINIIELKCNEINTISSKINEINDSIIMIDDRTILDYFSFDKPQQNLHNCKIELQRCKSFLEDMLKRT